MAGFHFGGIEIVEEGRAIARYKPPCRSAMLSSREVNAMAKDVLCEVNSCRHWAAGNKCAATSIYVVSHSKTASNSEETDCKTFEPKI